MSIIAQISDFRGHSRVTTKPTLSILAKASSFSSRSLAVFRSRSTFPFGNYGRRRSSHVYPLFSKRSNICSSHGTNERNRREREPLRQLWESDIVGFAISCSGYEMAKPLNSLRQRERQGGAQRGICFTIELQLPRIPPGRRLGLELDRNFDAQRSKVSSLKCTLTIIRSGQKEKNMYIIYNL